MGLGIRPWIKQALQLSENIFMVKEANLDIHSNFKPRNYVQQKQFIEIEITLSLQVRSKGNNIQLANELYLQKWSQDAVKETTKMKLSSGDVSVKSYYQLDLFEVKVLWVYLGPLCCPRVQTYLGHISLLHQIFVL